MLEPREADIPALFLVLVVLPLVTYILLGKWSEAAQRKERISLLAQLAAEEALRAEAIFDASVIPVVTSSKNGFHECARCFGPATTRCSRCKSVRYCSGKCQIIHWRHSHKQECQQLETTCSNSSSESASIDESFHERVLLNDSMNSQFFEYNVKQSRRNSAPSDKTLHPPIITAASTAIDTSQVSTLEKRLIDRRVSCKFNREMLNREDGALSGSSEETYRSRVTSPTLSNGIPSKEASIGHKLGSHDSIALEEQISKKHYIVGPTVFGHTAPRSTMHESHNLRGQTGSLFESRRDSSIPSSLLSAKNGVNRCEIKTDFTLDRGNFLREGFSSYDERVDLNSSPERISVKGGIKSTSTLHPPETKISSSSRSTMKALREFSRSGVETNGQMANESKVPRVNTSATIPAQGGSGVSNTGVMKMMGLRKLPKLPRQDASRVTSENRKKNKVLFPYEEFVKFFQCEGWDLSPRGLLNCGNSCYANAVLQCLTCTKPLIIYLLQREHSRTCCVKDWCLMCELEQHVMMLRESGGPLSPSRILSHMRKIGCHMGGGSQEDAHEFLRLLVTSMQFICLERLGGEKEVNSKLQETTFIQHTFGGHLRSTVKCLRCHHESERYENFMDLTLEILGWVESLEDALTQFTAPEDLDGENMYRCGRCAAYVQARKQLSIHEAPNILTVVLKRFQKGRYGKINKCITFPDMLDMIPFMTGIGDIPSLYMLYAVVVHLDALNESFSGHYVSYVKDLKDMWFRIDDTEVNLSPH
ncbi:hypothetical protein HHK36_004948 [Tetracentron sinense]|uniref:ubiquitinyl hydrolase 1 n=1 Tax=Tetracentron sinense TaxID=13715 RepID=A0A834ZKE3_TETSI|nr:hypothetical protein HHK36_004948 [Tetracentron sinense]